MIIQSKQTPNRITSQVDAHFVSCTKLAYQTEQLESIRQASLQGGMVPNGDIDEAINGGNPIGAGSSGGSWRPPEIIGVSIGVASLALSIREELGAVASSVGEAFDTAVYWVDAVVDAHSRAFNDLTGFGF